MPKDTSDNRRSTEIQTTTMTAFIDLTASDDEPDKDSHVTGENAFFRELEILRAQNRKLEHENSKLESQLKETRNELKFTRESLGQAIVAMQVHTFIHD